jgi:hypothetical protein
MTRIFADKSEFYKLEFAQMEIILKNIKFFSNKYYFECNQYLKYCLFHYYLFLFYEIIFRN